MKGREAKGASSTDLLACFPSTAPRPICSPPRYSEPSNRQSKSYQHHRHLKNPSTRYGGKASPLLCTKTKSRGSEITEPSSPKVTCAGQIKVRPKTTSCKRWKSVVGEIEKGHDERNERKGSNGVGSLGFKKEIVQFVTCLRRFDLRCFGSLLESNSVNDNEEEEESARPNHVGIEGSDGDTSKTVPKLSMLLQDARNSNRFLGENNKEKGKLFDEGSNGEPTSPPPNALLLMRSRSAPAQRWLEEKQDLEDEYDEESEKKMENDNNGQGKDKQDDVVGRISLKSLMEEEKRNNEKSVVMGYETDFYKLSSDIVKETWLAGGLVRDSLSRS